MSSPGRFNAGRNTVLWLLMLLALSLGACGGETGEAERAEDQAQAVEESTLSAQELTRVQEIAKLADSIEAAPQTAARLLEEAGMSMEEFQAEIYRISADPDLSRAYESARRR